MAYRSPAPFPGQLAGDPQDQMRRISDALSRKADATSRPTYSSVMLMAPDGSCWDVSVSNTGVLLTTQVAR